MHIVERAVAELTTGLLLHCRIPEKAGRACPAFRQVGTAGSAVCGRALRVCAAAMTPFALI